MFDSYPKVSSAVLLEALSGAAVCTGTDTTLPIFRCVHLFIEESVFIAESTDRYCGVRAEFARDEVHTFDVKLDVDHVKRAITWLKGLPKHYTEPVTLRISDSNLQLMQFEQVISLPLSPTDFPKFVTAMPMTFPADFEDNFIRFNPDLLAKLAKLPNGSKKKDQFDRFVDIGFSNAHRAAVARWKTQDIEWTYIIMPMRGKSNYEWPTE